MKKFKLIRFKSSLKGIAPFFIASVVLNVLATLFIWMNFRYLPERIGIFFTRPFGEAVLGSPKTLFLVILISLLGLLINLILSVVLNFKGRPQYSKILMFCSLVMSGILAFSTVFIVYKSSSKIFYLNFEALRLLLPWLLSFFLSLFFIPKVISFAYKVKIIDDPLTHKHPGQILSRPVPRAGALAFFLAFVLTLFLVVPMQKNLVGIVLGALVLIVVALIDDKYKYVNPKLRLILELFAAALVVGFGIGISYISNPFGQVILLDTVKIPINFYGIHNIVLFADLLAILWIVFLANAVSWSNGIDGQYSGFIGITALVICFVSLKTALADNDATQLTVATIAAIVSGASFGLAPATWFPQKVLWGFGATVPGLIIGALSILSLSKIYIVSMVLIVPLVDAVFTGLRRIAQKKSPFYGDRGHLHHRLLDLGWSRPKIAIFYWLVTGVFGVLAILSNENDINLNVVRFGVLGVFVILFINVLVETRMRGRKQPALKSPKEA